MGSGAWKKLGKPSVSLEAAAGAPFDDPPDGEQPASMPAPAAPTAAMPPNLNKSRRESSMISLLLFLVGSPFSPEQTTAVPLRNVLKSRRKQEAKHRPKSILWGYFSITPYITLDRRAKIALERTIGEGLCQSKRRAIRMKLNL